MKAHIDANTHAENGLVYTLTTKAANAADITATATLLHGKGQTVFAGTGYSGAEKWGLLHGIAVDWQIASRRSTVKRIDPKRPMRLVLHALEHAKASIGAKVEHPFHVGKNLYRYRKSGDKGLEKNTAQVVMLLGRTNRVLKKQTVQLP